MSPNVHGLHIKTSKSGKTSKTVAKRKKFIPKPIPIPKSGVGPMIT